MKDFEKFIYKKLKSNEDPMVTITKAGGINFNVQTMITYVKNAKNAILYFNKKDFLIGIKLTNESSIESYTIRKSRDGKFGSISGVAFLKHYKILHENTRSYSVEWNEQEQLLIIDLKDNQKDINNPEFKLDEKL